MGRFLLSSYISFQKAFISNYNANANSGQMHHGHFSLISWGFFFLVISPHQPGLEWPSFSVPVIHGSDGPFYVIIIKLTTKTNTFQNYLIFKPFFSVQL